MLFIQKNFFSKYTIFFIAVFLFLSSNLFAESRFYQSTASLSQEAATNIANDDLRGEDLEIRETAIQALGKRAGTIVVMNAQTGRIYTIVNQKWAIEDGFKPCSTIKLVTGIAGYKENLILNNGNLARGSYRIGLDNALAYSNNAFFQKVGKNLGSKKMIYYAQQLGLGQITGINADNEYAGQLPYGNENLRIYSHADDFRVTPLQLSVMVSAITNGGKILVPRIPYTRREKARFRGSYRANLSFAPSVYERVIPGMMGATKYGTAGRIKNADLKIAGKTGSCISRKTWVGLFASVAPINNPKFSVVVITRGQYSRGKYSAAIAEKIYRKLLPRYNDKFNRNLARKTIRINSAPDDIGDVTAGNENPNPKIGDRRAQKPIPPPQQPIKNTVITYKRAPQPKDDELKKKKTKELFPTVIIQGKTEITRPRIVRNE
jgi:membrane peptidoglycan carboxypeptidase